MISEMEDEKKEEISERKRRQLLSMHFINTSRTVLTERPEEGHGFYEYARKFNWSEKYGHALKNLIPIRNVNWRIQSHLPASEVGCFSFISSSWLTNLMWKSYRTGMSTDDVWDLHEIDCAHRNYARLEYFWKEELKAKGPEKASLSSAVWKFSRTRVMLGILLMIITSTCQFIGPAWVQNELLNYIEDHNKPQSWGLTLVAVLLVTQLLRNICFNLMFVVGFHTAIRVMGSLQYMMYMKLLKLRAPNDRILGKLINMCTKDQDRICEAFAAGPLIIGAPLMTIMSLVYSYALLGPWTLLGNFVLIGFTPLLLCLSKWMNNVHSKTVRLSDQRISLTNTVLNNIKLIKIYAWERSFFKKIIDIRHQEHKHLRLTGFLQSIGNTVTPTSAALSSVATFLGYTLSGNNLQPTEAFAIFSIFNSVLFSMGRLPYAVRCVGEADVCLKRIKEYLQYPEFETQLDKSATEYTYALELTNTTFAWEVPQAELKKMKHKGKKRHARITTSQDNSKVLATVLFSLNLKVKRGTLLGICGGVGSGKSSLLSALVGELKLLSGKMNKDGTVAYVTQQAWIFKETLRENILFGLPFNEHRYNATIVACGLRRDLELLSNGDMTDVGENGFNLSGGQKQRVNLARAVYSNRDIYLLDDTLSAVDASVASYIFHNCIHGPNAILSGKTIIMATHNTMALDGCDMLIVLKDGAILEYGTPAELAKLNGGEYSSLLNGMSREGHRSQSGAEGKKEDEPKADDFEIDDSKNQYFDKKYVSQPVTHPFRKYLMMCGGYCISLLAGSAMIIFSIVRLFNSVWLQIWLDAGDGSAFQLLKSSNGNANISNYENETVFEYQVNHNDSNVVLLNEEGSNYQINHNDSNVVLLHEEDSNYFIINNPELWLYLTVYFISLIILMGCCILKSYADSALCLRGSKRLHDTMLDVVIRKPIRFFDQIQSGNLLNRFSKDMDEVDITLPFFMDGVWQGVISVVSQVVLVCIVFPYFMIAVAILACLFIIMDIWLNEAVRQVKTVASTLQSPVIHFLSSTVSGLTLIRTYEREEVFRDRFNHHVNRHLAGEILFRLSTCWFTLRMDLLATVAVLATALITVLTRGTVTAAEAGNALACIFTVGAYVASVMRLKSDAKARFTAVERILEYTEGPVEADHGSLTPSLSWPEYGSVKLDNVCLRYGPEKPLVLKNISFEIQPSEKIGIVGRTGAGKTSLIATLMRLVELESGKVLIDGVDVSQIGLAQLRAAIAVIPQDPVLFGGTLRYNLDPFDEHSDSTLWDVLDKSHLKKKIQKEEKGLMMIVEADGDNFSVGEKQLVCLARALLRRNRILLLDEATASVDMMTDRLIQLTLNEAFSHCTLLTIAHRLDTVLTYDRIVVMDDGQVVEFDKPEVLREKEGSIFRTMLEAMGIKSGNDLLQ